MKSLQNLKASPLLLYINSLQWSKKKDFTIEFITTVLFHIIFQNVRTFLPRVCTVLAFKTRLKLIISINSFRPAEHIVKLGSKTRSRKKKCLQEKHLAGLKTSIFFRE